MNEVNTFFKKKGDTIYLINSQQDVDKLIEGIENCSISAINMIGEKGLLKTLIESCSENELGFDITTDSEYDEEEFLIGGENCKQLAIISVNGEEEDDFVDWMFDNDIRLTLLGHVTKGDLRIDEDSIGHINKYL